LRSRAGQQRRGPTRINASLLGLFGEAGYARNNSNVPTRRHDGIVGRVGILFRQ
jgi:hypothetical protein